MAALYRRYRPETFQEVIGQAHVTEPLSHALAASTTHHAYLFSGPRGCGKTTSARILARCLNCAQGPTNTPCGGCPSCVELARDGGGSLDVVEIDAASHNGVDDARELRERAVFAPARDRYKVFILDEAHMVTQQGFNALLKIVEEPPEHVKFIFATTEPEKVLTTIRSRTHHYPFRLVPPGELLSYLEQVVLAEGVSVERGVLPLVVQSGEGSVRDSLSILDQLIAGTEGKTLSLRAAQALLGYTPRSVLNAMMVALAKKNSHELYRLLGHSFESGLDPRRFVGDLLSHVRDVIVVQATGESMKDLFPGASEEDTDTWRDQSRWFSAHLLSDLGHVIAHSLSEMSGVTSPKLQLELLAAQLLSLVSESASGMGGPIGTSQMIPSEKSSALPEGNQQANKNDNDSEPAPITHRDPLQAVSAATNGKPIQTWNIDVLSELWPTIIEEIAQQKRSLWVAVSQTRPLSLDEDVVTIGFTKRSDAEVLKKPQGPGNPLPNADILRDAILRHSGHRVRFTVIELEQGESAPAEQAIADPWPKVSGPNDSDQGLQSRSDSSEISEAEHEINLPVGDTASRHTKSIASRGEPVVRQLLGGELVAEELLETMSEQGESNV